MLRDKSNKRDRIRSNLLATLSKSGTAMAVPAVPVATALLLFVKGSYTEGQQLQLPRVIALLKLEPPLHVICTDVHRRVCEVSLLSFSQLQSTYINTVWLYIIILLIPSRVTDSFTLRAKCTPR